MKGLEALNIIGDIYFNSLQSDRKINELPHYKIIEKELKALEIMKQYVKLVLSEYSERPAYYLVFYGGGSLLIDDTNLLDLLKEVLKNE